MFDPLVKLRPNTRWWVATLCLLGVGCSDSASIPRTFTAEAFEREVLDRYALVVVGYGTSDDEEQRQLREATEFLRDQTQGSLPCVSVLTTKDDWANQDRQVRQTPVLVAYHNGEEVAGMVAPIRERQMLAWLEQLQKIEVSAAPAVPHVEKQVFTATDFDTALAASEVPVLVDFWATWCGPCRMIDGPLQQIADNYQGRLTVAKVDVDAERSVARRFVTSGIPLLVLFHRGREVDRLLGARSEDAMLSWLETNLEKLK